MGIETKEPRQEWEAGKPKRGGEGDIKDLWREIRELAKPLPQPLHSLLDTTPDNTIKVFNCYDKMPNGRVGRVAFIGDASHAFNPFAGNGANQAIVDGYDLAQALTDKKYATIESAVDAFDQSMIKRATWYINLCRDAVADSLAKTKGKRIIRNMKFRLLNVFIHHPSAFKYTAYAVGAALLAGVTYAGYASYLWWSNSASSGNTPSAPGSP